MDIRSSLLPYTEWLAAAMREVAIQALERAADSGLPGEHHFFLTFRTDMPGVEIPRFLRAEYPELITVVLQHRFWGLAVDRKTSTISVGMSFREVESMVVIPFAALVGFRDPSVRLFLDFSLAPPVPRAAAVTALDAAPAPPALTVVAPGEAAGPERDLPTIRGASRSGPALSVVRDTQGAPRTPGAVLDFDAFRRKRTTIAPETEPTPA